MIPGTFEYSEVDDFVLITKSSKLVVCGKRQTQHKWLAIKAATIATFSFYSVQKS